MLAADPTMQRTIKMLLEHRRGALGLTELSSDVLAHRNRDPGCRTQSGDVLIPLRDSYRKALVMLDYHGCGEQKLSAQQLEIAKELEYRQNGWGLDRVVFVVIEPELEAWIFASSLRHLEHLTGWVQTERLQKWLKDLGYLIPGSYKPVDPKSVLDLVLRTLDKRRSAKLFADLAQRVTLANCQDRAFLKFRDTLQRWFAPAHES